MKKLIFLILPIICGIAVFGIFLFFFTKSQQGNGALQITSVPESVVYLNGKNVGKTPLCLCEGKQLIPSGIYAVKLVPVAGNNLLSYEDSVLVTKGTLTVVDRTFGPDEFSSGSVISLLPLSNATLTQVAVNSFPSGASVQLDGTDAGQTPLSPRQVTNSDHDITVSKTGYEDKTIHVHAVAGYQLKLLVTLGIQTATATPTATPTPTSQVSVVILQTPTGFLRVRSEPTLSASETAQVKPGDKFGYVDEQDGWYEITLSDGTTGWISTQYAKKQ